MKKKILLFTLIFTMLSISIVSANGISMLNGQGERDLSLMVAHAGGAIYGFRNTNSLEALNNSYKNGFRYIEMDFDWTSDGVPVAIHDWDVSVKRLFKIEPRILSHEEFKSLGTFQNLTLMDLEDIVAWLESKPDPFIITDVKEGNVDLLRYISENYPHVKPRFIPQVYTMEEYYEVRDLGYKDIIFSMYKVYYTDDEILNFAANNKLFGLTMHYEKAYGSLTKLLENLGVKVYVHTINDLYIFEELYENGVKGIYTDYFELNNFPYI